MDGCEGEVKGRGYCSMHYWRLQHGRPLGAPKRTFTARVCKVSGCDGRARARRLCDLHYSRFRAGKSLDEPRRRARSRPRSEVCSVDGCSREYSTAGYCGMHYQRSKGGKLPMDAAPLRQRGRVCSVDGCGRKHGGNGFCRMHLDRFKGGRPLDAPLQMRGLTECIVEGCTQRPAGRGLCHMHYSRANPKRGRPPKPLDDPKYGSVPIRSLTADGYVRVNGNVLEHRVVMQQMLGRKLHRHENVHHKNGNRADNRPENLELWSSSQPSGQRIEDKVAWAREIIAMYGDLVDAPTLWAVA